MVTINGTKFNLKTYQKTPDGVTLTVTGTTTDELERVIGNSATVIISDEYHGYGMRLASIYKKYGTEIEHVADLTDSSIDAAIQQNAAEIELNAEAIAELADIIAGGE